MLRVLVEIQSLTIIGRIQTLQPCVGDKKYPALMHVEGAFAEWKVADRYLPIINRLRPSPHPVAIIIILSIHESR